MKNNQTTTRLIKPKKTLISIKETNKVVFCLFLLTVWCGLMAFCNFFLLVNNNKLAGKRTVFVQKVDGDTIEAREEEAVFRSDEVIRATIANWLPMLWEWDNHIPGSNTTDNGVSVGSGQERFRVPTRVYVASYLLSPRLRWEHLKAISKEIPKEVYQGSVRSVFEIQYIGKPIREKDSYKISVRATRTDINDVGQLKRESRFEKTITLIPVEPYRSVDTEASAFRKQLESLSQGGLIVTSIENLKLEN